jgi:hypothetical protein
MKIRSSFGLAVGVLVAAAGLVWAQSAPAPGQPAGGHAMMMGSTSGHAGTGTTMAAHQAMVTRRTAWTDEERAMDAKLDKLVQAMDAAHGTQKVDALAAVVRELVTQRRALGEHMLAIQPTMMQHAEQHAQMGTMSHMGTMHGMSAPRSDAPAKSDAGSGGHQH